MQISMFAEKINTELTPVFTGLPYCSLRQSYSIGEGAIESPIRPIIWLQRRLLKPNVTRLPHRISISRGTSGHWGKYAEMEIVSAPGLEKSTVKAEKLTTIKYKRNSIITCDLVWYGLDRVPA